jgi:hypothetical protein
VIWLNAIAWIGATAAAAPLLIHLLVRRRARQFLFPTLRFVAPTRLAAIRRHVIEDLPLLAVRAAILIAAAAGLAGPLMLTPARHHTWNSRIVRAVVLQSSSPLTSPVPAGGGVQPAPPDLSALPDAYRTELFDSRAGLQDGLARAAAWLDAAPPARRELVIAAPLTVGSLDRTHLDMLPDGIGLRLIRTGLLPASHTVTGPSVLAVNARDTAVSEIRSRTIQLNGASTSVRETAARAGTQPFVRIVAPENERRSMEAALMAVLSNGVTLPPADRRAVVASAGAPELTAPDQTTPIRRDDKTWLAEAVATLASDEELRAAARQVSGFLEERFRQAPWHALADGGDGRPLIAAAPTLDDLIVVTAAPAADIVTPILIRAVFKALAAPHNLTDEEILPIPETTLRAWERAPGDAALPHFSSIESDDRRWLWGAALALLGLESWLRRKRPDRAANGEFPTESHVRVA